MAGTRRSLSPSPGERGLASHEPMEIAALLEPAWAWVERTAERIDLDAPTRLPGWSARQVLVHLGSWDDGDEGEQGDHVATRVAEARSGSVRQAQDPDARNARLVASHHDASRDEVIAALRQARQDTSNFLLGDDVAATGARPVSSVVGELPLTGLFVARGYELAVHALDLLPAGAPGPDKDVLVAGLAALTDVTGALVARVGTTATFAVVTPVAGWVVGVRGGDWTTSRLERGRSASSLGWPGIEGTAEDVLDASAGRAPAAQLLLTRRLRAYDVPGLLQLLPAFEGAPGLPGGAGVRAAARVLAGAGRAVNVVTSRISLRRP